MNAPDSDGVASGVSSCTFKFNPDEWEAKHDSVCVLEDEVLDADGCWQCPHDAYDDSDHCLFHLPADQTPDEKVVSLLRDIVMAEPGAFEDRRSRLRFYGATVGDLDLQGLKLRAATAHPIDLRFARITGDLRVADAEIDAPLWLTGGVVKGQTDATDATFGGDVHFTRATLYGQATFSGAAFDAAAQFDRTAFRAGAAFDQATFAGRSTFEFAEFESSTSTLLQSDIDYAGAVFRGPTTFESAVCRGSLTFQEAVFHMEANFEWMTFDGRARFSSATFGGDARCWRATFHEEAIFANATFEGETTFSDGTFEGSARFGGARFDGPVRFEDCTVPNALDLQESTIDELICDLDCPTPPVRVNLRGSIVETGRLVQPAPDVVYDCTGGEIGDVSLVFEADNKNPFEYIRVLETDFEGFDFGTAAHRRHLWDIDWNLHRLADPAQAALLLETPTASQLESTYIKAKIAAKTAGDSKGSAEFFRKEMRFRRHQHARRYRTATGLTNRGLAVGRWFANGFLDLTSGYGERPWRVIAASVVLIFGFAAMYYGLSPTLYDTAKGYLTLSMGGFVTLILGNVDVENTLINLLVQSEGFLGAFFIALFVFTLTRSIHR